MNETNNELKREKGREQTFGPLFGPKGKISVAMAVVVTVVTK